MINNFELEILSKKIILKQGNVCNDKTLGMTVWDASIVLSKYIVNEKIFTPGFFKDKRIIEIGAGTGLISIVCSYLGGKVTATDMNSAPVLNLLKSNLEQNNAENVEIKVLKWGETPSNITVPYDIVLAADVIFKESLVPPLIETMKYVSDKNSILFMCAEIHNRKANNLFLELAANYFEITVIPQEDLDPLYNDEFILK